MSSHRYTRRSMIKLIGGVAAAPAVLAGCTSAVDNPQAGQETATQAGGTLIMAQNTDAQPAAVMANRGGNVGWLFSVFEPLTRFDENFDPQPVLATSTTLSDDAMSMDIELRDDVTFHSGRAMTAEDVKYSFEQATDPVNSSQLAFVGAQFAAIKVTSDTALTITFSAPLSNIYDFLDQTVVVDRETFADIGDGKQVIGTGPFRWESWKPGAQITLKKYAEHRDADGVLLDGIELPIITDSTAQISALRSGRAQVGLGMSTVDALGFDDNPSFDLRSAGGVIYPLGLNVKAKPFTDQRVREAVGYAIDRARINQQVFAGQGVETDLFWSPKEPGYSEELASRYTYDPDRATSLIKQAGATGAKFPIVVPAIPATQSIFEIVRNNLEAVGLKPTADTLDVTEFDSRQVAGNLGPAFLLLHGQIGYSAATMISSLPSLRKGNPSKFDTPKYRELRSDLLTAPDKEVRAQALEALSAYVVDQAFTIPMIQAPGLTVVSTTLQGFDQTGRGVVLTNAAALTK